MRLPRSPHNVDATSDHEPTCARSRRAPREQPGLVTMLLGNGDELRDVLAEAGTTPPDACIEKPTTDAASRPNFRVNHLRDIGSTDSQTFAISLAKLDLQGEERIETYLTVSAVW